MAKAMEKKLELDASEVQAQQRYDYSSREIQDRIDNVRSLENSKKYDYEVKSTFETASGRTTIEVKASQNQNAAIIAIAIIAAIVVLIIFAR